jgi:hypothetical protein
MQDQWVSFWAGVDQAAHQALSPFRAVAEFFGGSPSDIQIWAFLCALFVAAIVTSMTYGDLVLRHRRVLATGRVVKIDTSGDGPDTPVIEFTDRTGKTRRFDSHLPVTGLTKEIGSQVAVMYDPENPKRAREVGRPLAKALHYVVWYAVVVGLFAAAFLVD